MRHPHIIRAYLDDLQVTTSPNTYRHHRSVVLRAEQDLPAGILQATPDELHDWLHRHRWTPGTRASYLDALRSIHAWCATRGITDYDPAAQVDRIRVPRRLPHPLTDDELTRILSQAPPRVRLWSLLAAYLGLRRVEVARLHRSDATELEVRIRGKGGHQRVVPMHPLAWRALAGLPPGPVADVTPDCLGHACGRAYRALGIAGSIHRCRHWYASRALEACKDIRVVQELLGHASVATTQIYTAVTITARRAAVAGLPTLTSPTPATGPPAAAGAPAGRAVVPAPGAAAGPAADAPSWG